MEIVSNMEICEKDRKQWRLRLIVLYAIHDRDHGNSGFNINFLIIISYNLSSLVWGIAVSLQRHAKTSRELQQKLWNINVFFFANKCDKPFIIRHCLLLC